MRAKKSLGQHFLHNEQACQMIVNAVDFGLSNLVIEVGPGRGALTKYLVKSEVKELVLIETDREFVPFLAEQYKQVKVIEADFLQCNLEELYRDQPFTLIGNFPYNISSQIVFKLLDHYPFGVQLVGMFQKEMAYRILSPHGSKKYGILSVFTEAFYHKDLVLDLGPESFTPPPKVDSTVIKLIKKNEEDIHDITKTSLFRQVVKMAFGQRRKMIRNSLKALLTDEHLNTEHPVLKKRPEQITLDQFIELTMLLSNTKTKE